jgi:hypothetical protein
MTRDPDGDADVVPFPNQPAAAPTRGTSAVAAVIAVVGGIVELGKLALMLTVMVLAGFGLAALLR